MVNLQALQRQLTTMSTILNQFLLDYIKMNQSGTSNITANLIDGLMENDQYGDLIPSLAKIGKCQLMV